MPQPATRRLLTEARAAIASILAPLGPSPTASAGGSTKFAREDHVHPSLGLFAMFGDGSDGDIVLDGVADVTGFTRVGTVYTCDRTINADDLTINTGVTLRPKGELINVLGTLSGAGTITASPGRQSAGGAKNYPATLPGGVGAAGTTGAGSAGVAANNTSGVKGTSGAGGASGTPNAGGASQLTNSAFVTNDRSQALYKLWPTCFRGGFDFTDWSITTPVLTRHLIGGAPSGGSGGGDGTNVGGKGGDGGQVVIVNARKITGSLTISAPAENGGAAAGGNAGGGGGGAGGLVILNTTSTTGWTGSLSAPGGAGGAKAGTGVAGGAGTAGITKLNVWV